MKTLTDAFNDFSEAWLTLARAQLAWSQELAQAYGAALPAAFAAPSRGPRGGCGCAAKGPCFMPQFLGERRSHVGRCETVTLSFRIENCDRIKREFRVLCQPSQNVTVSPAELELAPKERAIVTVSFEAHEKLELGKEHEMLIWVQGCQQHYLRWIVTSGGFGFDSTALVEVADCPDYRHHWSDHFTCERGCPGAPKNRTPGALKDQELGSWR